LIDWTTADTIWHWATSQKDSLSNAPHCGSKVGSKVLGRAIRHVPQNTDDNGKAKSGFWKFMNTLQLPNPYQFASVADGYVTVFIPTLN
jgi:hypothetical protein